MYIVVSKWGVLPKFSQEAAAKARNLRNFLRSQPGVGQVLAFENQDGVFVSIVAYENEDVYNRLINDPNGPFAKAVEEQGILDYGVWVGSDRGHAQD